MRHDPRQADRPAVPTKAPNNPGQPGAEGREGSGLAEGNLRPQTAPRTPGRVGAPRALERVREVAPRDRKARFTALRHPGDDVERRRAAYDALKRDAAPGSDGETWRHYGAALEATLADRAARLQRGA